MATAYTDFLASRFQGSDNDLILWGGCPRFTSTSDRDTFFSSITLSTGQAAWTDDAGLWLWTGGGWVVTSLTSGHDTGYASGTASVTHPANSSFSGPTTVSFPSGRFSAAPAVTCTQSSLPANSQKLIPKILNVTSSQFSLYVYMGDSNVTTPTSTFTVDWVAVVKG